ncbi:hypothetical protein DITRI_Ditri02bG0118000 [Diplodiscus trichospermus]
MKEGGMKLLSFHADSPPLSIIAAAKIAGITLPTQTSSSASSILYFSNGLKLHGNYVILRYIGRLAAIPNFYGDDAFHAAQIDEWLEYSPTISCGSEFENACSYMDAYLEKRTFFVSHCFSIADIAIWSGLAGTGLRWESIRKSNKYPNLVHWYNSVSAEYSDALKEVTALYVGKKGSGKQMATKVKEQKSVNGNSSDKAKVGSEIDLPDAEIGKVRPRFAPEPSGYLHIGHSKAALLNQYFAQRYQGEVILRFDDTNPTKESNEFVENLIKDVETLGIKYQKVTYTSDYFSKLMDMAEKLIKEGKAYVDDTPIEQMQKEGWMTLNQNCCLRGKLDMQDPNKSLRDPVCYRCNPVPHHRIGSKYKVYPTYDFACPYVDAEEGITHALRSSEYHDRNAQYYRI